MLVDLLVSYLASAQKWCYIKDIASYFVSGPGEPKSIDIAQLLPFNLDLPASLPLPLRRFPSKPHRETFVRISLYSIEEMSRVRARLPLERRHSALLRVAPRHVGQLARLWFLREDESLGCFGAQFCS